MIRSGAATTPSLSRREFSHPRLLVSVRTLAEARIAVEGGCDIVDLKEPLHGSLGKLNSSVLEEICATLSTEFPNLTLSAALGEATETTPEIIHPLSNALHFVKLGCAGLNTSNRSNSEWLTRWETARELWQPDLGASTQWIAVAYADWERAHAPHPRELLSAAIETGSRGVLIDTFMKDGRGLLEWMSTAELATMSRICGDHGIWFAVAGSLRVEDLTELSQVTPDIVGVRGAACRRGDRTGNLCVESVANLRQHITPLQ